MPDRVWLSEAGLVLTAAVAIGLVGLWFGHTSYFLLAGGTAYLGWHLTHLYRLSSWLKDSPDVLPPQARGIWGSVFRDIYRRRRRNRKRKRKLSQALKRFTDSTAALPDAIVVLGRQGEIEWWNTAAERLLGLRRPEDRGQRIANLIRHPAFIRCLEERRWRQPVVLFSPVDEDIWLTASVVPTGKNKRLLIARDSTRLLQLEQIRRDFVANVSHELRTPLTVISGYLETLLERADAHTAPWNRALPQIHQQTRRMQRLVEDLLLLSRLELDKDRDDGEMIRMEPILRNIHEEALALSGKRDHHITLDADSTLGIVGNGSELHSAFSNLVFNAVRYTPSAGEIQLCWFADDRGAHFSVRDTGVGIEARHLPRLTERFYRIDVGRSRESGGTGLGLAIVKHVLTRHDGELTIESEVGRGSTFTCHFPSHCFCWFSNT